MVRCRRCQKWGKRIDLSMVSSDKDGECVRFSILCILYVITSKLFVSLEEAWLEAFLGYRVPQQNKYTNFRCRSSKRSAVKKLQPIIKTRWTKNTGLKSICCLAWSWGLSVLPWSGPRSGLETGGSVPTLRSEERDRHRTSGEETRYSSSSTTAFLRRERVLLRAISPVLR